jgi:hypothetical protein
MSQFNPQRWRDPVRLREGRVFPFGAKASRSRGESSLMRRRTGAEDSSRKTMVTAAALARKGANLHPSPGCPLASARRSSQPRSTPLVGRRVVRSLRTILRPKACGDSLVGKNRERLSSSPKNFQTRCQTNAL